MSKNEIIEDAFLYILLPEEVKIYRGTININVEGFDGIGDFKSIHGERFVCSNKSNEFFNSMVWLENRDDQLASDIMIKYHEDITASIKKKMDERMSYKINLIRGELKKMNNLKEWAMHEIELANQKEDSNFTVVYDTFLNYLDMLELSKNPELAKSMFANLVNHKILSPIEEDEDWEILNEYQALYRSTRSDGLYKRVRYDDQNKIKNIYTDVNRAICYDIDTNETYVPEFEMSILNELLPITMPYTPSDYRIKIYVERFKYHKDCELRFDTFGILYFRTPDGKLIKVERFFKNNKNCEYIEIDKHEYFSRKIRIKGR